MIVGIYIHDVEDEPTQRKSSIQCEAGYGIKGDFYHARAKAKGEPAPAEQHITLTAAEAILACREEYGLHLRPAECRRNLITVGVSLNPLVGKTFKVGPVTLKGIKLAEPCGLLEKLTGLEGLAKAMRHRAGLRCEILESGEIREGDAIEII